MAKRRGIQNQIMPWFFAGIMTFVLIIASGILSLFGIAPFMWLMIQLESPAWFIYAGVIFMTLVALGYVFTNFNTVRRKR